MTPLFPLSLRGVGTADVEAFGTYLHRLAGAHGISAGRLLDHAISCSAADSSEESRPLSGIHGTRDLCDFIRPNQTTQHLVEVFAEATGSKDLRCGTFLALTNALDRSMGTFVTRTRWCPACMSEFEVLGDAGYFKLLWQLQTVTHCPTHRLPLRNKCVVCGAYQSGVSKRRDSVSCFKCGSPLSTKYQDEPRTDSWESSCADLVDLGEAIASDAGLVFPAGGVRQVLATIFEKVWADEEERRFWKLMPRDTCIGIVTEDLPVTLPTARRVAYHLGMRLPELLAGTVAVTSDVLDPEWTSVLPETMRPRKRRGARVKPKVLEALRSLLAKDENRRSPPALEAVASQLGVSVGYLHYHFPTIASEVLARHKEWVDSELRRKHLQARSAALMFLTDERYVLEAKSRKRALRVLRTETGLPKNILREEIGTAFRRRLSTTQLTDEQTVKVADQSPESDGGTDG